MGGRSLRIEGVQLVGTLIFRGRWSLGMEPVQAFTGRALTREYAKTLPALQREGIFFVIHIIGLEGNLIPGAGS